MWDFFLLLGLFIPSNKLGVSETDNVVIQTNVVIVNLASGRQWLNSILSFKLLENAEDSFNKLI